MSNDLKTKIAQHWDRNVCDLNKAKNFDELDKLRPKMYPYLEKELRLQNLNNKKIIEIGVGSAIEACTILRKTKPLFYVLYDISKGTLKVAQKHLYQHINTSRNWQCVNGDMENINSLSNGFFDRVHAIGSIHHTPIPQKAINEISRILKTKGEFLFMFYSKDSFRYKIQYKIVAMKTKSNPDEIVRRVDGENNPLGKAYTKKEVKKFCQNAGLEVMKMSSYENGFALYVYGVKNS